MASTTTTAADTRRKIQELLLRELPDDRADAARLDELRRVFAKLVQDGDLVLGASTSATASSARARWQRFLRTSHDAFVEQLQDRIRRGKRTALRTLWGVVASSPTHSGSTRLVILLHVPLLVRWVRAVTALPVWDQSVHHMIQAEFVTPFRDVQYYLMMAIRRVAQEGYLRDQQQQQEQDNDQQQTDEHQERFAQRLQQLLMLIPLATSQKDLDENVKAFLFPIPASATLEEEKNEEDASSSGDDDDDSSDDDHGSVDAEESSDEGDDDEGDSQPKAKRLKVQQERQRRKRFAFERATAHARQWCRAWLAVLRLPQMPVSALKQALQFLPTHVLPHVRRPLLFADFFIQAYQHNSDGGGVIPILALDGLFVLMTQHGLEYPAYYKQLYKLVTPTLFYVRYRNRFFRLLDRSISRNDLLPARTVAAFCKRLLRSALRAPPAGILTALALTSNWLRKHTETAVLIHASSSSSSSDPFDATQDDPAASNALHSSLWELQALSQHYLPAVVTLAAAVGSPEQDATPLLDMEDFYQQSYHQLFEQERKRQRKSKSTPLTFQPPAQLFASSDVFAGILDVPTTVETTTATATTSGDDDKEP